MQMQSASWLVSRSPQRRRSARLHSRLRDWPGLVLAALLGCLPMAASAQVYKWTDAQGQVHFSDKPPAASDPSARKSVSRVTLDHSGPDFSLHARTPLPDLGSKRVPLHLGVVKQSVMAAGAIDFAAGQFFTGAQCNEASPLILGADQVDFASDNYRAVFDAAFAAANWSVQTGAEAAASSAMVLSGEVVSVKVDQCSTDGGGTRDGSRAYLRLLWALQDADGHVLYRGSSEGAHDGWGAALENAEVLKQAVQMAVNNLLAEPALSAKIQEQRQSAAAVSAFGAADKANIAWGDGSGSYSQRAASIGRATVRVQAGSAVGSGVVIDLNGWALTSAQLVAGATNVNLLLGRISLPAAVVKRDAKLDVALLRFVRNDFTAVRIARSPLNAGDRMQIVTAPTSPGATNTVAAGAIAAEVKTDNPPRLPTTLMVKQTNAGAPVFNQSGELAALTTQPTADVAAGTAAVSCVPILEALRAVGVDTN